MKDCLDGWPLEIGVMSTTGGDHLCYWEAGKMGRCNLGDGVSYTENRDTKVHPVTEKAGNGTWYSKKEKCPTWLKDSIMPARNRVVACLKRELNFLEE